MSSRTHIQNVLRSPWGELCIDEYAHIDNIHTYGGVYLVSVDYIYTNRPPGSLFHPPWAFVGWALVGQALVGAPGPLWARPLWEPRALVGLPGPDRLAPVALNDLTQPTGRRHRKWIWLWPDQLHGDLRSMSVKGGETAGRVGKDARRRLAAMPNSGRGVYCAALQSAAPQVQFRSKGIHIHTDEYPYIIHK